MFYASGKAGACRTRKYGTRKYGRKAKTYSIIKRTPVDPLKPFIKLVRSHKTIPIRAVRLLTGDRDSNMLGDTPLSRRCSLSIEKARVRVVSWAKRLGAALAIDTDVCSLFSTSIVVGVG